MAHPGNPKPLAAILLALVLTALCLAADEKREAARAERAEPSAGSAEYSALAETFATVEP